MADPARGASEEAAGQRVLSDAPPFTGSALPASSDLDDEEANDDTRVVSIRWSKFSSKCFETLHQAHPGDPGMTLHIWDCPDDIHDRERFIIPKAGKVGPIKPGNFPSLCLSTLDGFNLQFQSCNALPQAQIQFAVRADSGPEYHHVHLAADANKCLDIPDANATNGNKVMLWHCRPVDHDALSAYDDVSLKQPGVHTGAPNRLGDESLLIEDVPVDCLWGTWSSWSRCSNPCGPGHQTRYRAIGRPQAHKGLTCQGDWSEVQSCLLEQCPESTPEPAAAQVNPIWSLLAALVIGCCLAQCFRKLRQLQKERKEQRLRDEEEAHCKLLHCRLEAEEVQRLEEEEMQRRRDEQGWLRIEAQRLERDEQTRRTMEARRERQREHAAQTEEVTCPNWHALQMPRRPGNKWVCDGRNRPGGCRSGIAAKGLHDVGRFRCEACDYDLCTACYQVMQRELDIEVPGEQDSLLPQPQRTKSNQPSPKAANADLIQLQAGDLDDPPAARRWGSPKGSPKGAGGGAGGGGLGNHRFGNVAAETTQYLL